MPDRTMAAFTWSGHTFVSPHSLLTTFSSRSVQKRELVSLKLNLDRGLEFGEEKKRFFWLSRWCKKGWDKDGDLALESDVLEFMRNSEKPEVFPSKKELVDAGRMDLVERIKRQGGWLAMGWELDGDHKDNGCQENETFQESVPSEVESRGTTSLSVDSSCSPSSSGGSLEVAAEDDRGIDGILKRLETVTNMNFGFAFRNKGDETIEIRHQSNESDRRKESCASEKEINSNEIQGRLEHLKEELSSVLQSVRSNVVEVSAWEELGDNEITNAQDKLRSLQLRLVVLQGRTEMAMIDARKTVKEKQKRIDTARKASQLLCTACIVWSHTASEVLLAGSFDGWTTQRKMKKLSANVFSLRLMLYPGKYEIKFIIDGEWKIDPLRPVVKNRRHENNLLIIT